MTGKILRWALLLPVLAILFLVYAFSGLMVVFFDDVNRLFGNAQPDEVILSVGCAKDDAT